MGIRLGSTRITIPGLAKIMHGDTLIYSSAPAGPVNYTLTQKSVLALDVNYAEHTNYCKVDNTHIIVAYYTYGVGGIIKTFVINSNYSVSLIDSINYDSNSKGYHSLSLIDSTHFALVYSGGGDDGFIKTFSIDSNCDNITEIDSLEHNTSRALRYSLALIDSTHLAAAYSGDGDDGFIDTFSIDGSYNITKIDSLEHDAAYGSDSSLIVLDSTHLALAYRNGSNKGCIKTFSIDANCDNITEIDSLEHDAAYGGENSLSLIDSTHLALAFMGEDNDGFIATFSIDGSYNITKIDSLEHDAAYGANNSLIVLDSTHLALAYRNGSNKGCIKTFSIDANCDNITEIDSLEHDTYSQYNSLSLIDSTHLALAFMGMNPNYIGYIKVFELD